MARAGAADGYPMTVTDALARSVTFPAAPRRVVAMGHAPYAQLASLSVRPVGAWVNPAFAAHTDYLFPDPASIPSIVNVDWSPDPELIAQLRPDLVIGWYAGEAVLFGPIAPFFAIREFGTIGELKDNLRTLGRILSAASKAESSIQAFDRRLAAYRQIAPHDRSVLFVSGRDTKRFSVATTGNLICQLADQVADCTRISPVSAGPYVDVSIETLLAADPDVLVLGYGRLAARDSYLKALRREPLWNALKAVRRGRVMVHEGYQDISIRGLATASRALDLMVPMIYPERLPGPFTESQLLAFVGQ